MQSINPTDPAYVAQLNSLAASAASVNALEREPAEQQIKHYQNCVDQQLGFVPLLLHVVSSGAPSAVFCSIVLKNTVKECWNPSSSEHCVQEHDKAVLRSAVIGVMLQAPPSTQRNLAETIALIADVDFPLQWPDALDLIIKTLDSNAPMPAHCAALSTAHSILVKYRSEAEMSESYVHELRTIYSTLLAPLVRTMTILLDVSRQSEGPVAVEACKGLVSAAECLVDITSLDLAEEFLNNLNAIVDLLLGCLGLRNPALSPNGHANAALVELKSVVTSCVNHFLLQFDEDFEAHTSKFLEVVWSMLADSSSAAPEMNDLVVCGLELLASACTGTCRTAFDNAELLQSLIGQVIVPNLMLQPEEIEMYTEEPDAYILRDVEGSDVHTRRRAAGELVRTLVQFVPEKAKALFSAELTRLFAASGSDWMSKNAGIFLASSLALEGQRADAKRGVTQQLSSLVPFEQFLRNTILPELSQPPSAASPPIIKADCIRVVSTFRYQIDPALYPNLLAVLPMWVGSDDLVLLSYAAHALERLLLVQHQNRFVVTDAMFAPYAQSILDRLCTRISETEQPNAYIAQCLMRICQRVGKTVIPYVGPVVVCMNLLLHKASKNPSNPLFSHCLFEVLSKCIALDPSQAAVIEGEVWESLIFILSTEVLDYIPYALQIMAQLLDCHPRNGARDPPAHYQALLEPLTNHSLYQQKGSIPAVTCLLTTFIYNYPEFVHNQGLTEKILNIFRFLVGLKNYDHEGLNILTAMMISYPADVMGRYLDVALQVLLQRLQTAKTPKFVRILIIFLSVTVCVRSVEDLSSRLNRIQPGLFMMICEKVWLLNVQKITGVLERKVCLVALTKLLLECTEMQGSPAWWAQGVYSCLRMIHNAADEDDRTSFAPKLGSVSNLAKPGTEEMGLTNVFCPLEAAVRNPVDVCESIVNPDQYFRDSMSQMANGPYAHLLTTELRSLL